MSAPIDRVHRALSEFFHAERVVADQPAMFWVYSNSGERYAVDIDDEGPICTCRDWIHRSGYCKHIWYCLLTDPEALTAALAGGDR